MSTPMPTPASAGASLAEALDACEGMAVNVEIKNLPTEEDYDPSLAVVPQVVEELRRRGKA